MLCSVQTKFTIISFLQLAGSNLHNSKNYCICLSQHLKIDLDLVSFYSHAMINLASPLC